MAFHRKNKNNLSNSGGYDPNQYQSYGGYHQNAGNAPYHPNQYQGYGDYDSNAGNNPYDLNPYQNYGRSGSNAGNNPYDPNPYQNYGSSDLNAGNNPYDSNSYQNYGSFGSNPGNNPYEPNPYQGYGNYDANAGNNPYESNQYQSYGGYNMNQGKHSYNSSNYSYGQNMGYNSIRKRKSIVPKLIATAGGIAALIAIVFAVVMIFQRSDLTRDQNEIAVQSEETIEFLNEDAEENAVEDTGELPQESAEDIQETTAQPAASVNELDGFYYNQLTEEGKQVYTELVAGIQNRDLKIRVSSDNMDVITRSYDAVTLEHPEFYWLNFYTEYSTVYYESQGYGEVKFSYMYNVDEMAEIDAALEASYQEVSSRISADMSEYDKIRTVYEWIIDHVEYISSTEDQVISGALWKRQAVCAGYARSLKYLLGRIGISSTYVTGDMKDSSEGHAWIIVNIEGNNYIVDVTWGDQPKFLTGNATSLEEHKTYMMDYLFPFPEEYYSQVTPSTEFQVPECTSHSMNFYVLNGAAFDSYDWQSVYSLCAARIDNGAAVVRFKFTDEAAYAQAKADLIDNRAIEQITEYYMEHNGLSTVRYSYGLLDEMYTMYFMF